MSDATKSVTEDEVLSWPEIGQTENEEWGVDDVRAKKINGKWCYVQLNWRYHTSSIGWVLYDGRLFEEADSGGIDLQLSSPKAKKKVTSEAQGAAGISKEGETNGNK